MELLWNGSRGETVSALTTMAEIEELVSTFESIADTEQWIHEGQFRTFAQNAIYFQLDFKGEIAGGLQLVRSSACGKLPTHAVWPELPERGPHDAHILMLTVKPEYRRSPTLFWQLCAEMWRYCWRQEIKTLWLEATPETHNKYVRLGWPLKIMAEGRVHWGEECFPCELDLMQAASDLAVRSIRSGLPRAILSQLFRPASTISVKSKSSDVDGTRVIRKNRPTEQSGVATLSSS